VATVEEYTDPYLAHYAYVPPAGSGICEVCHVVVEGTWTQCESCNLTRAQVSRPARVVVPVSLFTWPGQLHHVLRNYKDGWTDSVRDRLGMRVSATLGRFLREHEACLSGDESFDVVTVVPSSKRPHPHPLEDAVMRVQDLRDRFRRTLDPGVKPILHRRASDTGFEVNADVGGATVLIIDDTFTSGAALQSAASAIRLAGAADVATVTVGRFFRPEYNDTTRDFWAAVERRDFSFDRCCLEPDPTWIWPPP